MSRRGFSSRSTGTAIPTHPKHSSPKGSGAERRSGSLSLNGPHARPREGTTSSGQTNPRYFPPPPPPPLFLFPNLLIFPQPSAEQLSLPSRPRPASSALLTGLHQSLQITGEFLTLPAARVLSGSFPQALLGLQPDGRHSLTA